MNQLLLLVRQFPDVREALVDVRLIAPQLADNLRGNKAMSTRCSDAATHTLVRQKYMVANQRYKSEKSFENVSLCRLAHVLLGDEGVPAVGPELGVEHAGADEGRRVREPRHLHRVAREVLAPVEPQSRLRTFTNVIQDVNHQCHTGLPIGWIVSNLEVPRSKVKIHTRPYSPR